MPFQSQVYVQPAIGIQGDFASANPHASFVAGPGGLVAGADGVTVGTFAWVEPDDVSVSNAQPSTGGAPDGFVFRDWTASIQNIYDETNLVVQEGYMVTLMTAGDYFAVTSTVATRGQKVFASLTDGTIATGAAGATVSGYVETEFYVESAGAADTTIKIGTWK